MFVVITGIITGTVGAVAIIGSAIGGSHEALVHLFEELEVQAPGRLQRRKQPPQKGLSK